MHNVFVLPDVCVYVSQLVYSLSLPFLLFAVGSFTRALTEPHKPELILLSTTKCTVMHGDYYYNFTRLFFSMNHSLIN